MATVDRKTEIVFIAHHTEAKEVTEEDFFTRGESGGTIWSSAYLKALEIMDSRYPKALYNVYPFHFPDGDNLTRENERCVNLIKEMLKRANIFASGRRLGERKKRSFPGWAIAFTHIVEKEAGCCCRRKD